ncbi:MAG: hypothetical protein M3014_03780 [Chloroflexota bacterium]|nr:hypothetical protein [Chloroflexota bacterium]
MDTDPNPFRDNPENERSGSSTEAPDDSGLEYPDDEAAAEEPASSTGDSDSSTGGVEMPTTTGGEPSGEGAT